MSEELILALTKGRILKETLPLLAAAGIEPIEDIASSRKLIFETTNPGVRLMIIRGADVPTYVRHGVADAGVAGKDTLEEYGSVGLYEPLDLGISKCKLMTAGPVNKPLQGSRLRIASKFVNIAKRYFAERGEQVELIKLNGALELAPLMGLADGIVDIVDTGNTLKANGLEPKQEIMDVSSRFIVNKAAMKMKHAKIQALIKDLTVAVAAKAG